MTRNSKDSTFDLALIMKDAGLIAASAAAEVSSVAKIIDLGAATRIDGRVIVDISAIEIASNDEEYSIIVQGSASATFASGIQDFGMLNIGATEVRQGGGVDGVIGRYEIHFTNEINGTAYRYLRLYTYVAGTINTGINYKANLALKA